MAKKRSPKKLVTARDKSIEALFKTDSFHLDYYQRAYVWEKPQVKRLLDDLSRRFSAQWSDNHTRQDVSAYDPYFLGPCIICTTGGRTALVDGQQRIITLLLLLIYLQRRVAAEPRTRETAGKLHTLIMSERFGRRTFRVDVDEYAQCFFTLLKTGGFHDEGAPLDVQRISRAYQLIDIHFPADLRGEALVPFIDWLLYRVSVIVMDAGDRERAEEMFQSINDCGVRLSPMDHLKRFILSDAQPDPRGMEGMWSMMVSALDNVEQGAASAYLRTVLRARFPDAANRTGVSLADATHEWVRAHEDELWPKNGDKSRFLSEVLYPFHSTYIELLRARHQIDPNFKAVRYNAFNGITEQFDLTIAALRPGDSDTDRRRKAALIAGFLDLFYVTQTLDDERVEQKHIDGLVSTVMPTVRLIESADELSQGLGKHAADWPARLQRVPDLSYDGDRTFLHYMLTRLTAWIEMGATNGEADPTERLLMRRSGDRDFEIEHLFTSSAAKYANKVPDAGFYGYLRNRIGALLLLEGRDNGSYGGALLEEKLTFYRKDTRLAGMLNPDFFQRGNVHLREFLRDKGLLTMVATYDVATPLEPFIEARGNFYHLIAKHIWSLEELGLAPPVTPGPEEPPKRTRYGVRFPDLVRAGLVIGGDRLVGRRRGQPHYARVRPDGSIETTSGATATSPTKAMENAVGASSGAWSFWQLERTGERLDNVRQRYLDQFG